MPDQVVIVRSLPAGTEASVSGRRLIELPMSAEDRRRVRRPVTAPDGVTLALELPTGTLLRPGQALHLEQDRAYVVAAAAEDVLIVRPRSVAEAASIGHLIGNLHRDIDLRGDEIVVLWDQPLEGRLRLAGVSIERARQPFYGRPNSEHSH